MQIKSKKHKQLLEVGKSLFWKHGFKKVTIEEVCQKSNVSKMTFYRYFNDKFDFAKDIFDLAIDKGMENFREIMSSDLPFSEKIQTFLKMKIENTNGISKEFLLDFYNDPDLEISKHINKRSTEIWNSIMDDFRKGQEMGLLRNDFKPEVMLIMLQKVMEITKDEKVLSMYNNPQELIIEIVNFFTYAITPHK